MIELLINGIKAELPEDNKIDMVYENEFFTSSSEYSLDIDLPLKGSSVNQRIFGNINRRTLNRNKQEYKAEIYNNGKCICNGYAVILSGTDNEVSIQLVGNTSYTNYISIDTYINEMDLGKFYIKQFKNEVTYVYITSPYRDEIKEAILDKVDLKDYFGSVDDSDTVMFWALYKDLTNLKSKWGSNDNIPCSPYIQASNIMTLVNFNLTYNCQPYFVRVLERIIKAMGFKIRRNDIMHSWMRNIYICNYRIRFDKGWIKCTDSEHDGLMETEVRYSLPHWTLSKFLNEVEKFFACNILFNTYNMTVDIIRIDRFYDEQSKIYEIEADKILDSYEYKIEKNNEEKDIASNNVTFNKNYSDNYIQVMSEVKDSIMKKREYDNYLALDFDFNQMEEKDKMTTLFLDLSNGREYIGYKKEEKDTPVLREINVLGDLKREGAESTTELNIIPANTKLTEVGFFKPHTHDKIKELQLYVPFSTDENAPKKNDIETAQDIIDNNYQKDKENNKDGQIEVMLSTGDVYPLVNYNGTIYHYPLPFTDFLMNENQSVHFPEMSLSLKNVCKDSLGYLYRHLPTYKSNEKYIITFMDIRVPDVRSIFLINNQKYVCRKLSTTFDNSTSKNIIEGEFYRIS